MADTSFFRTDGDPRKCRPFRLFIPSTRDEFLASRAQPSSSWFSGDPPLGVVPPFRDFETRFLATLGIDPSTSVSIFTTVEFGDEGPYDPFQKEIYSQDSVLAQFVLHEPRDRVPASAIASDHFPSSDIVFGAEHSDGELFTAEAIYDACSAKPSQIYMHHKNGGLPIFYQTHEDTIAAAIKSIEEGYYHLLQLCFPGPEDSRFGGSWRFGYYTFHVYCKKLPEPPYFDFRYQWG